MTSSSISNLSIDADGLIIYPIHASIEEVMVVLTSAVSEALSKTQNTTIHDKDFEN